MTCMGKRKDANSIKNWSYKHDYPIEEVWNTNHTLAQLIVPRLLAFKALDKHGGCPAFKDMQEWNNAIQKMIDAFELMKYDNVLSDAEQAVIDEGLELFCKHYRNLWD